MNKKECTCANSHGDQKKCTCCTTNGCATTETTTSAVKTATISAEELRSVLKEKREVVVANVLDTASYQECHIAGSVSVPFAQLAEKLLGWKKDAQIVLYCANDHCPLSKNAAELLLKKGFTHVRLYEGGIDEWKTKKYEIEGTGKK